MSDLDIIIKFLLKYSKDNLQSENYFNKFNIINL